MRDAEARPGPAVRVLVVDDEAAVRRSLERLLSRAGYQVRAAETVAAAVEALDEEEFAVVVTDLHLPGASGLDLLVQVRTRAPDTRLILISGAVDVPAAAAAIERGIDALVTKPFEPEQLRRRVDEAASRHRTTRTVRQERELLEARLRQREAESRLWVLRAAHALTHAVEAKDSYTAGHAHRVTGYAMRIAEAAGGVDLQRFRLASDLHDVGKIGVPDAVLNKAEALTADEATLVRRHSEVGGRILEPLIDDPLVIEVVRSHHERWDGTGYPDGLSGEAIPLGARILAVADSLDAMTSTRSYRPARPWEAAVDEVRRGAGTQFDPAAVAAFDAALPALHALHLRYAAGLDPTMDRSREPEPADRAPRVALVADDDPMIRALLEILLAGEYGTIHHAESAGGALARSAGSTPLDLSIIEIDLGGDDGVDVARRLVREHPRARVLCISARECDDRLRERLDGIPYVRKDARFSEGILALLHHSPVA